MAEIYRGTTGKAASLDIEGAVVTAVKFVKNGTDIPATPAAENTVLIPYAVTHANGDFSVHWTFTIEGNTYNRVDEYSVVTPYASLDDVRDALGNSSESVFSDADIIRAERRIRGVIDSFTGQSFGLYEGTRTVIGAGDTQLKLTERLVSINSLGGAYVVPDPSYYAVRGGGYYIGAVAPYASDGDMVFTSVIRSPDSMYHNNIFRENVAYTINGTWGWESVPTAVQEAAVILIEDYLDPDSEYRERYLNTVRAADWNLVFHDEAFRGTGNAKADNLLKPYIRWSMTVV
jgi:hypothetical protein